jgi:RHS repeat-associated protein
VFGPDAPQPSPAADPDRPDEPAFRLEAPSIALPKGGGAIKAIDEKFTVNRSNGTLSLALPLPFTPARGGTVPPVRLAYDSGSGNSVVGLGWSFGVASISRKTEQRLPMYDDTDVFVLAGSEDLVPMAVWDGNAWREPDHPPTPYRVRRFRPRIDRELARIELISDATLGTWWRVTTGDNVTTYLGIDDASRIADPNHPGDGTRVFTWLPACTIDDKGNVITYEWVAEDLAGVIRSAAESNRQRGLAKFANRHLKRVRYGNRVAAFVSGDDPYRPPPIGDEFLFEAVFDYGEHDPVMPTPDPAAGRQWAARPDAYSSYRPGFDLRTNRLLQRALMFHRFDELESGEPTLVRSLDLAYSDAGEVSQLVAATARGYVKKPDGTYHSEALPPIEFDYEPAAWDDTVHIADLSPAAGLPVGVTGQYQWVDLFGEGLAGVFSEHTGAWRYSRNLGGLTGTVAFEASRPVAPAPSLSGVGRGVVQIQDLDADGRRHVVVRAPEMEGYFEPDEDDGWNPFVVFPNCLRIDLHERHVRTLDLVGDGRAHLLVAEQDAFVWYRSLGRDGHVSGGRTPAPTDEERGPAILFADRSESVILADMTGDGLSDIARIRNGEVCYWPNLGYGRFGAKVTMNASPRFDDADGFDANRVHTADLTGTGATDLVYDGRDGCTAWSNLSGNGWSERRPVVSAFPAPPGLDLSTTDLLGNGTTCLVWSSSLPADTGLRYVDPMAGHKPYLLRGYANNVGKRIEITYRSSTSFRLQDEQEGHPWRTRLAFPVHCVARIDTADLVAGTRLVSEYRYHHGCFDVTEREFRGFGMVELTDAEQVEHWDVDAQGMLADRSQRYPPTLTKTWFHVGVLSDDGSLLARYPDEHWDAAMRQAGFPVPKSEPELPDGRLLPGPDTPIGLLADLTPGERREAARACKGAVLRTEVFALDAPPFADDNARRRALSPFTVTTNGLQLMVMQPSLEGQHAVLATHENESLTRHYERNLDEPRVAHRIDVEVDEAGKVRRSATVAYGRLVADPTLPLPVSAAQARPAITVTANDFTADVSDGVHHRLRLPSRSETFEIRGLVPAASMFAIRDFSRGGFDVLDDTTPVAFFEDSTPPAGQVTRRLLSAKQTRYLDAALTGRRSLNDPDARALEYERYELAFDTDLVTHLYGARVDDATLTAGGYVHLDDASWWAPSGRHHYLYDAENASAAGPRFFTPVAHEDVFGARTDITHLGDSWLLIAEVADAASNHTRVDAFDLRTLAPVRTIDPNGNIAEVRLDALGRVKASALLGKGNEGDTLDGIESWADFVETATVDSLLAADSSVDLTTLGTTLLGPASTRYVYDEAAFIISGGARPARAVTIAREQHHAVQPASPVQIGFEYTNGAGNVELHKVQAEAGIARRATIQADGFVVIDDVDTASLVPPQLRWLGNGRQVKDNKGRMVKEYEPFFSTTPMFENAKELVETGMAHLRTYDPLDRLVRVDHPDGTLSRTVPAAWSTVEWDRNDTVLESDWHRRRVLHEIDGALLAEGKDPTREAEAAQQTEAHAGTPFTRHLDALGHPILEVSHAGFDAASAPLLLATAYGRDLAGRVLTVTDPRGVATISYDRDLRGMLAAYRSADSGNRWMLADARSEPLRSWDQRNHTFSFLYDDPLHRLTAKRVEGGDGPEPLNHVFERRIYGEGRPGDTASNLRTKVAVLYDTAGRTENVAIDFKGNLTGAQRRFASRHNVVPDWGGADPDAALASAAFNSAAQYDALGRISGRTTPDGSVAHPTYNAANLLETITVTEPGAETVFVTNIDYDEIGRRKAIAFGNGLTTNYAYDRETFRLLRLTTRDGGGVALQDHRYTYDPQGNITHLEDLCVPTVWYAGQMVTGLSRYDYDATYRLVAATGREHIGSAIFGTSDNWQDAAFAAQVSPNDVLAWRNYTQSYGYDASGNLTSTAHQAGPGSWTRTADYATGSNRLLATHVAGSDYTYASHAAHGFLTSMPHLSVMAWNFRDELQATATQVVNMGTPETTWYVYDGDGKRVRKVVEAAAAAGAQPVKRFERFYLDGVEIAFEYANGGDPTIERHTLHIEDAHQRVALVETEHDPGVAVPTRRLIRYQAPDHVDSAELETDDHGTVISYEVFHPFGTTAYQATAATLGSAARRYRYTGMERDEESGLGYHGHRYYAPWIGRWIAADQHPDRLDGNRYAYVKNNPMVYRDPNGLFEEPVHGALTYRLALAAGFSADEAAEIAIATAGMDHEADTRPGDSVGEMQLQILRGATQIHHYPSQEAALNRINNDLAEGALDLRQFGRDIHSLEDVGFKDAAGPHDRSPVRLLAPAVLTVSALAIGLGIAAAIGAHALLKAGGGWAALGVLAALVAAALFAFALYAVIFAILGAGTGHPTYKTERGGWSNFWSHAADRAFSDPKANTTELFRVYEYLKKAAKLRHPDAVSDDDAAKAAIKETVEADTQDKINALFNTPARDNAGNCVPSYGEVRTHAPWHDRPPDVSLEEGNFVYEPKFKSCPVR